jgi:hypothetical protein
MGGQCPPGHQHINEPKKLARKQDNILGQKHKQMDISLSTS